MPRHWVHPTLTRTYSITGGFLHKPMPVDTVALSELGGIDSEHIPTPEAGMDPISDVFVKLDKSAEWLIKAVGGWTAQRGFLRRTSLLEDLKEKLEESVDSPAVAGDDDPMGALCDVDTPKKKRKYICKRKWRLVVVSMPQCEPTRYPDSTERRAVRLLGLSTNQVWLQLKDVPWLLTWLADAITTGGVPTTAKPTLTANSTAVAGVNVKWDFVDSWEAVILTGSNAGATITATVSEFNEDKWAHVDAIHKYGVSFANSTYEQRKAATLHFLESYCKRMTDESPTAEQAAP